MWWPGAPDISESGWQIVALYILWDAEFEVYQLGDFLMAAVTDRRYIIRWCLCTNEIMGRRGSASPTLFNPFLTCFRRTEDYLSRCLNAACADCSFRLRKDVNE